VNTDTD